MAVKESLQGHIRSEDNPSDLLTNVLTGLKRKHRVSIVPDDIFDGDT